MFILEKPYVSGLLKETLAELGQPVLENNVAQEALQDTAVSFSSESDFVEAYNRDRNRPVYSNSENAI